LEGSHFLLKHLQRGRHILWGIVVIRKVGPTIIVYGISFLLFILILTKIAYTVSIVTEKRTKISFGI